MSDNTYTPNKEQRVVRVFISSTFLDMEEEREELVKFVFPELRRRCKERLVEFTGIDLRWGITDQQKAEGGVLPICLKEIEKCRPYFIGILGERYGWIAGGADIDLQQEYPWLKNNSDKSITELEILHGVLENPEMKSMSFFYFRNKNKSQIIENALFQKIGYTQESDIEREKLEKLKREIEKSGCRIRKDYNDSKAFGRMVVEDLWGEIDGKYPKKEIFSELEKKRIEHETFAASRTKNYVKRQEYFDILDKKMESGGPPTVICGEPGSGKTALIANWSKEFRKKNPDVFVIPHYTGGASDSADYIRTICRMAEEVRMKFSITDNNVSSDNKGGLKLVTLNNSMPDDSRKRVEDLSLLLSKVKDKSKIVLIIDAINQMEDRDNALDLWWLPWNLPENIRLIVSTTPGRSYNALKKRGYNEIILEPLNKTEQKEYINEYLMQYRKQLNHAQLDLILKEEQVSNPMYLGILLEELRVFGRHEQLEEKIAHYLKAKNIEDLYGCVLERLETDYDRDKPGLTRETMSLIWASRDGLTENELIEMMGSGGNPVPRAYLSPLFIAAEDLLINRMGLFSFMNRCLRNAVKARYLSDESILRGIRLKIADYFSVKPLDDRKAHELPWQLSSALEIDRLKDCLAEEEMFMKLFIVDNMHELGKYWQVIGDQYEMTVIYKNMIKEYENTRPHLILLAQLLNNVAMFYSGNNRGEYSLPLYVKAAELYGDLKPDAPDNTKKDEKISDLDVTCESTGMMIHLVDNLASDIRDLGDYENAEKLYRKILETKESMFVHVHPEIIRSLNDLGLTLKYRRRFDEAEGLYDDALKICGNLKKQEYLTATVQNNLALLYVEQGKLEKAEFLLRKVLEMRESMLGIYNDDTAQSYKNLGGILNKRGKIDEGEKFIRKAIEVRERVLGGGHTLYARNLTELAELLCGKKEYVESKKLLQKAISILEKNIPAESWEKAYCFLVLGKIYFRENNLDEAETYFKKAIENQKSAAPDLVLKDLILSEYLILMIEKEDFEMIDIMRRLIKVRTARLGEDHAEVQSLIEQFNGFSAIVPKYLEKMLAAGDFHITYVNKPDTAKEYYMKALKACEHAYCELNPNTANVLLNLVNTSFLTLDFSGALDFFQRVAAILISVRADDKGLAAKLDGIAVKIRNNESLAENEFIELRELINKSFENKQSPGSPANNKIHDDKEISKYGYIDKLADNLIIPGVVLALSWIVFIFIGKDLGFGDTLPMALFWSSCIVFWALIMYLRYIYRQKYFVIVDESGINICNNLVTWDKILELKEINTGNNIQLVIKYSHGENGFKVRMISNELHGYDELLNEILEKYNIFRQKYKDEACKKIIQKISNN